MINLKGTYTNAKLFNDKIEYSCIDQIKDMINTPAFTEQVRIMPDAHAGKGSCVGFTMPVGDKLVPATIGVDIGCLDCDTEFLTPSGWKKISEYKKGDRVMQYNKCGMTTNFVEPSNYINKECSFFYHFKNNKGCDQMLSPEHKALIYKGYKGRGYTAQDFTAEQLFFIKENLVNGYYGFSSAFITKEPGLGLSTEEIQLDVMVSADGCIRRPCNDKMNYVEFHFKKERKIKRAEILLQVNGVGFKKTSGTDGTTYIYCSLPKTYDKSLQKYWNANKNELVVLSKECLFWDGHAGYRSYFSSTKKDVADVIQYAFTATGIRAGLSETVGKSKNWNTIYSVTPTKNPIVGMSNRVEKVKSNDGRKYCFTVPSGYFVARRNGKIFVTGNCGIYAYNIHPKGEFIEQYFTEDGQYDFKAIDEEIRKVVPLGFKYRNTYNETIQDFEKRMKCASGELSQLLQKIGIEDHKALAQCGSLGGGNHFVEIAKSKNDGSLWLLIHTGSRNVGKRTCDYHQDKAIENVKKQREFLLSGIASLPPKERETVKALIKKEQPIFNISNDHCWLEGKDKNDYIHDMIIAQKFAHLNKHIIRDAICNALGLLISESIESVHNYIDPDDMIIRKGAIRARKDEKVVIPFNMRDGSILAKGKGNIDWNNSAPHGAGRIMSRSQAKKEVSLEDFEETMKGVWSSSVNMATLDESPFAYKPMKEIEDAIKDCVEVYDYLVPVYNLKSD